MRRGAWIGGPLALAAVATATAAWLFSCGKSPATAGSKQPAQVAAPANNAPSAAAPPASAPPAAPAGDVVDTSTSVNVALADLGGHLDHVTGSFGPGYLGPALNDGDIDSLWRVQEGLVYPVDLELSFYEHQPALVSAVALVLPPDANEAPRAVEVYAEGTSAGAWTRVASQSLAPEPREQRIVFAPVETKRIRLRLVSGRSPDRLALAETRVFEGRRDGYAPLAERRPSVAEWKKSPRQAAQLGLDWLGQAAPDWDRKNQCFGCHVQAQVLMGQAIGVKNGFFVDGDSFELLERATRRYQIRDQGPNEGSWFNGSTSATQFAALGLLWADARRDASEDPELQKAVDWLLARQYPEGWLWADGENPPVVQGVFLTTGNAAAAFLDAYRRTRDEKYRAAAERAVAWFAKKDAETTQDRVYKAVTLARFGTPDQRRLIRSELERLVAQQQKDGGWKERESVPGSNAFATGQVLYALKQAGASTHSAAFKKGVAYLIETQVRDGRGGVIGPWKPGATQSTRPTNFEPTMWATIGLAGAYSANPTGGLEVRFASAQKPATRNVEIILDASGSMKLPLGTSTRWKTALAVLEELLKQLPADFNVALRTYGHRFSSRSRETCNDIELVLPVAPLDRKRVLDVAQGIHPRGETPLVRSVLATPNDLKPVGGGTVILITDGEESCHGNLKAAAEQLKGSGVDVTLNIVGFTLTGQKVEQDLGALARSTGGRFYAAQNGEALARAVIISALQGLPFEVFDASGHVVANAETSNLGLELKPGRYRVVVHAPGQELSQEVQVEGDKDTVLQVSFESDRFALASGS